MESQTQPNSSNDTVWSSSPRHLLAYRYLMPHYSAGLLINGAESQKDTQSERMSRCALIGNFVKLESKIKIFTKSLCTKVWHTVLWLSEFLWLLLYCPINCLQLREKFVLPGLWSGGQFLLYRLEFKHEFLFPGEGVLWRLPLTITMATFTLLNKQIHSNTLIIHLCTAKKAVPFGHAYLYVAPANCSGVGW